MRLRLQHPSVIGFCIAILFLSLTGCDSKPENEQDFIQQNHFIQSIRLVEEAGVLLQTPNVSNQQVDQAMQQMDEGLSQAYEVNTEFLERLDVRMPRFYTEVFIPGVESYRIGVEAADRKQQVEGLKKLSQWGQYWLRQESGVLKKFQQMSREQ